MESNINYSKSLPLISALVWGAAIFRLILYYAIYNISIVNYLEFTEVLTLFLNHLIIIIPVFAFYSIITFLVITKRALIKVSTGDLLLPEVPPKSLSKWAKTFNIILGLFFLYIFYYSWNIANFLTFKITIIFFGTVVFLLGLTEFKYRWVFGKKLSVQLKAIIVFGSMILCLLIYYVEIESNTNKKYAKNKHSIITLIDGEIIKTSSSNIVIGNTKNYLFLYNYKFNDNIIIPMSQIKKIEALRLRKSFVEINKKDSITVYRNLSVFGNDTIQDY